MNSLSVCRHIGRTIITISILCRQTLAVCQCSMYYQLCVHVYACASVRQCLDVMTKTWTIMASGSVYRITKMIVEFYNSELDGRGRSRRGGMRVK